ncbi:MAG: hypothetical protein GY820_06700 [Gammaproteobacteria bacterium]|nr:hypothetical protein [Gammaproteobacteria bacterium]
MVRPFRRRRHRPVEFVIGQSESNLIRTCPAYLRLSVQNVGSIDQSQLEQETADRWRKVPS